MEENKNMVRWTDKERELLAHFVRIAVEEKGYTVREACEFTSKKLGRSTAACEWQYQTYIKPKRIKPVFPEEDGLFDQPKRGEEIANDTELAMAALREEIKTVTGQYNLLVHNVSVYLGRLETTFREIKATTGELTDEDISYSISLIRRIMGYNH